jgi:hypothetical protein
MIDKITPQKLDSSLDLKLTKKNSMVDALNVMITESEFTGEGGDASGDAGVLRNVKGNQRANYRFPWDAINKECTTKVIGSVVDDKTKIVYFFLWSSCIAEHSVYAYDLYGKLPHGQPNTIRLIYKGNNLKFGQNDFVKADVVHINRPTLDKYAEDNDEFSTDAIIYFTDNSNEPRKINAYRNFLNNYRTWLNDQSILQAFGNNEANQAVLAYNEVENNTFSSDFNEGLYNQILNYSDPERRVLISSCTTVPLKPIETVFFENDVDYTGSNFKSTAGLQFAYQFVYKDGNESAISPYSKIFVPPVTISQGASTIVDYTQNNVCKITIPSSSGGLNREVEYIKILVREGENSSFLLIDEVKRNEDSINWQNGPKIYSFYNDKILTGISKEEVNKTYDAVPKKAQAQTVEENRLIYGNYVEGFDNVKATAKIDPITDDVNQPILKQVKVVSNMSPNNGGDGSSSPSPLSAGFILDFSEIDFLDNDSTVTFNMSVSPDRNFHVGKWSRVAPTNYNLTVDNYINDSDPYTDFSFYDEDNWDTNRKQATSIWGSSNVYGLNNEQLVYTAFYNEAGQQQQFINPKIGSGYLNPIIIKGGILSFSVSFKYTGGPLYNLGASTYLANIVKNLLVGTWTADNIPGNVFAENIQVSNTYTHSYDLGLNDFDTLQAGYPNIGLQAGQDEGSTVYAQSPAPDYRTFLISSIGHPDAYDQADGSGSWGVPPIGYYILNKAKAKFTLVEGGLTSNSPIKEVKLKLDRLYDLDIATCIRRPSMFAPWVVLTSNFWTGNNNADWTTYRTNSVVDSSAENFWDIGDYTFDEDELTTVAAQGAFPTAGDYYTNFKYQFGQIGLQQGGTEIASDSFFIYDGEAGAGGYNGTDEFNVAEISKCGTVPMYIGFVEENDSASYYLAAGNTDPTYKYFIGGTFFSGKPSMVGYNIAESHFLLIDGPGGGPENQLSFAPAMKGPSVITQAAAQANDNSLVYYSVNDYNQGLLHPDIEVLTSSFISSLYGESYKSFKSSSKHDFGVVYFDRYGRHGFVNPIGSVYAPGYSDQERQDGGKGKISMRITMTSMPPSWATHWKVVHSKSVTVDRFIQYSAGGAYVKAGEAEEDNERNIYVSLNYLQGSNVSYVSSFGARTPEGGLNMYKYEKGDRLRIVSYQNSSGELTYPFNYDFEVIDMVNLGDDQNPLYEADSNPDQWLKGDFVVLRNNFNYSGFDYVSVKNGGHLWANNCIVELYKPSRNTDGSKRFYYEIGSTFDVLSAFAITEQGGDPNPLLLHNGVQTIDDGDVYWRPVAVNFRDIDNGSFTDIIVNTEDDAGVNLSKSNFKSYLLESMTSTDMLRGDAVGLGRVHTVFKDATESRRMASITYSLPTNPLSKRNYYGSFNGSTLNFKDLPEKYGYINYILNRGDSIVVFQDDKVSVVPMNRNIIEQTDGASLAVSATDVLGKARFYAGAVGTDGHPESVVQAEESIYFVHASSGRVLRFTESGITDVTNYGMLSRIREELRRAEGTDSLRIVSGYDPLNEEYLLTIRPASNIASNIFIEQDDSDVVFFPGCTDPEACNFDDEANVDDGTCSYAAMFYDCDGNCLTDTDGDGICDELELGGCTDQNAVNYNPEATDDDGTCLYGGCTNEGACNFDPDADQNDGSCEYLTCAGCTDETAFNYDPEATIDNGSCQFYGCTDPIACNYDEQANVDDGSCTYAETYYDCDGNCLNDTDGDGVCDEFEVPGCTDETACNYNPDATDDDGSCTYPDLYYDCDGKCINDTNEDGICDELTVEGCTYENADNYNPGANVDNGSCFIAIQACNTPGACNYEGPFIDPESGLFVYQVTDVGCVFADGNCEACDGNGGVVVYDDDGDGVCNDNEVYGCTNSNACNYDPEATENDGSCEFNSCSGCMDPLACNFDETATISFQSECEYPVDLYGFDYYDCDGNCLNDSDGDGICDEAEIFGCTDPAACNYDTGATDDDGSCIFAGDCEVCTDLGNVGPDPACCPDGPIQSIQEYVQRYGLTGFDLISVIGYLYGSFETNSETEIFSSYLSNFDFDSDGTIANPDLLAFLGIWQETAFDLSPDEIYNTLTSNIVEPLFPQEDCPLPQVNVGCLVTRLQRLSVNGSLPGIYADFENLPYADPQLVYNNRFYGQLSYFLSRILSYYSSVYPGDPDDIGSEAFTKAYELIYTAQTLPRPPRHIVQHILDLEVSHEDVVKFVIRASAKSLIFSLIMSDNFYLTGPISDTFITVGQPVLANFLNQFGNSADESNVGFIGQYGTSCFDLAASDIDV